MFPSNESTCFKGSEPSWEMPGRCWPLAQEMKHQASWREAVCVLHWPSTMTTYTLGKSRSVGSQRKLTSDTKNQADLELWLRTSLQTPALLAMSDVHERDSLSYRTGVTQ